MPTCTKTFTLLLVELSVPLTHLTASINSHRNWNRAASHQPECPHFLPLELCITFFAHSI